MCTVRISGLTITNFVVQIYKTHIYVNLILSMIFKAVQSQTNYKMKKTGWKRFQQHLLYLASLRILTYFMLRNAFNQFLYLLISIAP